MKSDIEAKCNSVGKGLGQKVTVSSTVDNYMTVEFLGGRGVVKISISIPLIGESPELFFVEVKKGRGDLMTFVDIVKGLQKSSADGSIASLSEVLKQ